MRGLLQIPVWATLALGAPLAQEAVEVARQAGAHGVSFFEMGGLGLGG